MFGAEIMKSCVKFIRKATVLTIPSIFVTDQNSIETWLNVFEAIIQRPLYDKEIISENEDPQVRKKDPWWQLKKNVAGTLWRMFSR